MTNHIHTVGHSTRDFDEMLAMLRNNGITHLVDVRSFPSSRKFPQWNQSAIIDALPPDIEYRWIPKLGGRRHQGSGVFRTYGGLSGMYGCGAESRSCEHGHAT